jgi:hypothetical protein
MKIFLTSFMQVGLVAMNTLLITLNLYLGVFVVSFLISYLWAINVSRISVSTRGQKLTYALGAGCGAVTGLLIVKFLVFLFM